MEIIERAKNKLERTNVEFYGVALSLCKHTEICQPTYFPVSIELSISSVCRLCLEREQVQGENNGSSAPVVACSALGFTIDGRHWCLFGFVQRSKFVFSVFLCVCTLFYLDPQDLSHLAENCRSLMWVKQNYCASPAFFIGSIR